MKIRNGFVSNSSSSSFIVAVAKPTDAVTKITLEVDLRNYGNIIKNDKELRNFFKERYGDIDDNIELYDAMKKAIDDGKVVIAGAFGDQDEPEEAVLCQLGLEGHVDTSKIQIIESEGGY